jgi:hypothetical protein
MEQRWPAFVEPAWHRPDAALVLETRAMQQLQDSLALGSTQGASCRPAKWRGEGTKTKCQQAAIGASNVNYSNCLK